MEDVARDGSGPPWTSIRAANLGGPPPGGKRPPGPGFPEWRISSRRARPTALSFHLHTLRPEPERASLPFIMLAAHREEGRRCHVQSGSRIRSSGEMLACSSWSVSSSCSRSAIRSSGRRGSVWRPISCGSFTFCRWPSSPGVSAAATALRKAKYRTASKIASFHAEMYEDVHRRLQVEAELEQALDREQFELHFQPILAADGGTLRGAEALLRWRHPDRGWVAPNAFLPVVRESGLTIPVGSWVIEAASRQAAAWGAELEGEDEFVMSLNLDAPQFSHRGFEPPVPAHLSRRRPQDRQELRVCRGRRALQPRHHAHDHRAGPESGHADGGGGGRDPCAARRAADAAGGFRPGIPLRQTRIGRPVPGDASSKRWPERPLAVGAVSSE